MGPVLNIAASSGACALSDRGTWPNVKSRADLAVLVEGDQRLFNPCSVMLVSAVKPPHVKSAEGQTFVDGLTGPAGQPVIASDGIGGEPAFFPGAGR